MTCQISNLPFTNVKLTSIYITQWFTVEVPRWQCDFIDLAQPLVFRHSMAKKRRMLRDGAALDIIGGLLDTIWLAENALSR